MYPLGLLLFSAADKLGDVVGSEIFVKEIKLR
jgi:hypothetical protein